MDSVRVLLVGIGGYGTTYVDEMLKNGAANGAVLAGAVDPKPESSERIAALREARVPIFSSLDEFYRANRADLVVISAPIHLHAPQTINALAHGSNVLCEKPLCARLEEADRMVEAERKAGKFVAIGYQWSFSSPVQAIKRDILSGRLGRPLRLKSITLWPRRLSYYARNNWAGRIRTDRGDWVMDSPVNNATAHYLHNMLYLLGPTRERSAAPEAIEAWTGRANKTENYDVAAMRLTMPAGVEVLMLTAHAVADSVGPLCCFEFENGTVTFENDQKFHLRRRGGGEENYGCPHPEEAQKLWQSIAAVRTGERPACGIEAARCHTAVVNRLQELPIHDFPADKIAVQEVDGDRQVWVRGLGESFERAYADWRMPASPSR